MSVSFWFFSMDFLSWKLAGAISLGSAWFDSFCTSAADIPGIVLTRQHPFQHPQHQELALLGWVKGGFKVGWGLFRVGSRLVSGKFGGGCALVTGMVQCWFMVGFLGLVRVGLGWFRVGLELVYAVVEFRWA